MVVPRIARFVGIGGGYTGPGLKGMLFPYPFWLVAW